MAKAFDIGGCSVGADRCFVIAEAGVNHNGDAALAKELIREAKNAGADCVKFQTFSAESLAVKSAPKAAYQLRTTDPAESQLEMLRKLALPESCYPELLALCRELDIVFLSTPYAFSDVDFLDALGVPAFKVASGQAVEAPFLDHVASKRKPVILSTGMCTMAEVERGVGVFRRAEVPGLAVLQCTTNYPAAVGEANIRAMNAIEERFDVIVGFSDHTMTPTACLAAVARGAKVVEKHFTLDKSLPGPDQAASADVKEFRSLVSAIREVEAALGSSEKRPTTAELRNIPAVRRSIAARRAIAKGTRLTAEMLTLMRPATGLNPTMWQSVLGKVARNDIAAHSLITLDDLNA